MIGPLSSAAQRAAPGNARAKASYRGASTEAIRHHYDISNDFYGLWLDSTLTYSCGLWDNDVQTLRRAQEQKLDYLVKACGARGAERVLDVGCGWGGLLRRLLDLNDVAYVVGLTLSEAQARSIASWADERCEVRLENWADHAPETGYDAILSIEAFEHFADHGMTRAARIGSYRHFFERCHEWLGPGGRLAVQTSTKGSNVRLDRQTVRDLIFIADRIFPESELPWPSEILEGGERRFEVVSIRNDPEDYVRTLEEWLRRLLKNRARAEEMLGEVVVADYERYLLAASRAFAERHLGLMRIVFERV